jgi:hypothetical protein
MADDGLSDSFPAEVKHDSQQSAKPYDEEKQSEFGLPAPTSETESRYLSGVKLLVLFACVSTPSERKCFSFIYYSGLLLSIFLFALDQVSKPNLILLSCILTAFRLS